MSLILEALRRSEAERRRSAPPSLLGDAGPPPMRPRSAWPVAVGGLVAGLLLAAATAWWMGRSAGAPAADAPPAATPPAARIEPVAPPAPTRIPVEPVPPAAYAQTPLAPPSARPRRPPPADIPATPPPSIAAPAAVAGPTPDPGLGAREGDLLWSDVAPGAGSALPPLRVSMHVYAEDPARRFAIVDGQRVREGDVLSSGPSLLEVRRDGLRLGWQGRVLWVPR